MTGVGKKAEQSEATRQALLKVARRLFASRGYAGTSIEDIVSRARVTRGALYHHFETKQEVFRAVYEDLQRDLTQRLVDAALSEPRAEKHLERGCEAFLDACLDRAVQRIVLLDGPSVLGWDFWHDVDEEYSLGLLKGGLDAGMETGYFERQPVEPLAQVLLGALIEAGLTIARADDVDAARRELGSAIGRLIGGLRPGGPARRKAASRQAASARPRTGAPARGR